MTISNPMTKRQYWAAVQDISAVVSEEADGASLSSRRIADDVIASCGGDPDKIKAAVAAYRSQRKSMQSGADRFQAFLPMQNDPYSS